MTDSHELVQSNGCLTLATTVHNNVEYSAAMVSSLIEALERVPPIIVVDDCSDVAVKPCNYRYPVTIVRNSRAAGFCAASALAMDQVSTPLALLVDADVRFLPGDIHGAIEHFATQNELAWMGFRQVNFDGLPQFSFQHRMTPPWIFASGRVVRSVYQKRVKSRNVPVGRFQPVHIVHSSCALVRLNAYHEIGGFDRSFHQCESDTDLSLRFVRSGYRVEVDHGYTVAHEGSGASRYNPLRTIDLHRSSLRLFERHSIASRYYLRLMLSVRHAIEFCCLCLRSGPNASHNRRMRARMIFGVWNGYETVQKWLRAESK